MYAFQVYNKKSRHYRTVYAGRQSQAVKRYLNGHGRRRIVLNKQTLNQAEV